MPPTKPGSCKRLHALKAPFGRGASLFPPCGQSVYPAAYAARFLLFHDASVSALRPRYIPAHPLPLYFSALPSVRRCYLYLRCTILPQPLCVSPPVVLGILRLLLKPPLEKLGRFIPAYFTKILRFFLYLPKTLLFSTKFGLSTAHIGPHKTVDFSVRLRYPV